MNEYETEIARLNEFFDNNSRKYEGCLEAIKFAKEQIEEINNSRFLFFPLTREKRISKEKYLWQIKDCEQTMEELLKAGVSIKAHIRTLKKELLKNGR